MENIAFETLLALIEDLTDEQRATFIKVLDENKDFDKVATLLDNRILAKRECLYCKSSNVKKWGRQSGLQRMRCFDCGKSFNALTGTPLAHLRKKEEWIKMAVALKDGLTVKDTAEKCNSSISTAFIWRHRFLKAMKGDVAEHLEGITEAEETYFLESHKGSRNIPRKARKRGGKISKGTRSHPLDIFYEMPIFFKWITPWRLPSSLRLKWSGTHRGPCWASFMN